MYASTHKCAPSPCAVCVFVCVYVYIMYMHICMYRCVNPNAEKKAYFFQEQKAVEQLRCGGGCLARMHAPSVSMASVEASCSHGTPESATVSSFSRRVPLRRSRSTGRQSVLDASAQLRRRRRGVVRSELLQRGRVWCLRAR